MTLPSSLSSMPKTADLGEWPWSPGRRFFAAVAAMETIVISLIPRAWVEWTIIAMISPITPPCLSTMPISKGLLSEPRGCWRRSVPPS